MFIKSPVFGAWRTARRDWFQEDFQREVERIRGEEDITHSEQLRKLMAAKPGAVQEADEADRK